MNLFISYKFISRNLSCHNSGGQAHSPSSSLGGLFISSSFWRHQGVPWLVVPSLQSASILPRPPPLSFLSLDMGSSLYPPHQTREQYPWGDQRYGASLVVEAKEPIAAQLGRQGRSRTQVPALQLPRRITGFDIFRCKIQFSNYHVMIVTAVYTSTNSV